MIGVEFDRIPAELRELNQWVAWRLELRDGKPTKVPYRAYASLMTAAVDRPRTWSSFDVARERAGEFDGLGFVLTGGDPYLGVDLDYCRDAITFDLFDGPAAVIASLSSYSEFSPSGIGVRVFVRAALPGRGRKRAELELYDRGRFLTVTGDRLDGAPAAIMPRQPEVDALLATFPTRTRRAAPPAARWAVDVDDRDLVDRMLARRPHMRALWDGDTSGHGGDHSAADLALCRELAFWCGGDPARVDRIFRGSGLMRAKWDDTRGGEATYGTNTLELALASARDHYRPGGHQ
jgi:primase-polymerase (primpol)-like protein